SPAASDGLGRRVWPGVAPVSGGGAGEAGTRGAGWDEDPSQRLQAQSDELRADGADGSAADAGGASVIGRGPAGGRGGRRGVRPRPARGGVARGVGAARESPSGDSRSQGGAGSRGACE